MPNPPAPPELSAADKALGQDVTGHWQELATTSPFFRSICTVRLPDRCCLTRISCLEGQCLRSWRCRPLQARCHAVRAGAGAARVQALWAPVFGARGVPPCPQASYSGSLEFLLSQRPRGPQSSARLQELFWASFQALLFRLPDQQLVTLPENLFRSPQKEKVSAI